MCRKLKILDTSSTWKIHFGNVCARLFGIHASSMIIIVSSYKLIVHVCMKLIEHSIRRDCFESFSVYRLPVLWLWINLRKNTTKTKVECIVRERQISTYSIWFLRHFRYPWIVNNLFVIFLSLIIFDCVGTKQSIHKNGGFILSGEWTHENILLPSILSLNFVSFMQ